MLFQYGVQKLWTVVFSRGGVEKSRDSSPGLSSPTFQTSSRLTFCLLGRLASGHFLAARRGPREIAHTQWHIHRGRDPVASVFRFHLNIAIHEVDVEEVFPPACAGLAKPAMASAAARPMRALMRFMVDLPLSSR
jgi:hypothetical protein